MRIYAYSLPDVPAKAGWLKIGETRGDVEARVKQQSREFNLKTKIVWQNAVSQDFGGIDKLIHRQLKKTGFQQQVFEDTGADSEWIQCDIADVEKAYRCVKDELDAADIKREEVGQQFYLEIRNWFYWVAKTGDDPLSVAEPEYTLRLIVRLLFCFFLRDKGLIADELFDENYIKENFKADEYRYYNAVLRNVFFFSLNTPLKDRNEIEYKKLARNVRSVKEQFQKIPFLNGGIFTEHRGDDFALNDDYFFSEPRTRSIKELGGNDKVAGIIRILSGYNFKTTVDNLFDLEYVNTIDTEFIGKVFESLLACIDAENRGLDRRKVTGSFYTPQEVVDSMVNESLDAYLSSNTDLLQCKILDPACGSGAFLCGVMNAMMNRIDPDKQLPQQERYRHKLHILCSSICGIDIQPMAVQIAVLRLFLELIREIVPDKHKDNFGIEPLPNLETKFVCADTLIGLHREKQGRLEMPIVRATIKQLSETRNQYLAASSLQEKKRLQDYDETLRKTLGLAMEESGELSHETTEMLACWDPYDQTVSAPFFDPEWMFGIEKFDIVIGNPPYVQLQRSGGELAKRYAPCGYETFAKTGDIYVLFYERGIQLLKTGGLLHYITSNKWMRAGYGEALRGFLARYNPKMLLDVGAGVFESATVDTNILLIENAPNEGKTLCAKSVVDFRKRIVDFLENRLAFTDSSAWGILSSLEQQIKQKIEAMGTPLKDWDINIFRGILTGYNEALVIDGPTKDKLITEDPKSAEIIRPLLRGRDIKRYGYEFADQWLINTHNGIKEKGIKPINIDDYPAVKNHLDKYFPELKKRQDQGDTPYNLRNCAYMDDFYKQKIIYSELTQGSCFIFDEKGELFTLQTGYIIVGNHLKYLLAILNSRFIEWAFRKFYSIELGGSGLRWLKQYVETIPIPKPTADIEQQIENLLQSEDYQAIDALVYELYALTDEETEFLKNYEIEFLVDPL